MKKSLTEIEYWNILKDIKWRGQKKPLLGLMIQWDEIRTQINPDAKWYGIEQDDGIGFWEGTTTKDKFKCSKCGAIFKIPTVTCVPKWNYCPMCGQKNQEEGD